MTLDAFYPIFYHENLRNFQLLLDKRICLKYCLLVYNSPVALTHLEQQKTISIFIPTEKTYLWVQKAPPKGSQEVLVKVIPHVSMSVCDSISLIPVTNCYYKQSLFTNSELGWQVAKYLKLYLFFAVSQAHITLHCKIFICYCPTSLQMENGRQEVLVYKMQIRLITHHRGISRPHINVSNALRWFTICP